MTEIKKTKELIFDTFIDMTSTLGYENVSMREIAQGVGIQVASIYNHFSTKAEILDFVYEYLSERLYENRAPIEQMKVLIDAANAEELIRHFVYTYTSEDPVEYQRMVSITKIMYMRLLQDPQAFSIFSECYKKNIAYINEVIRYGIETGRVDPGFDAMTFAEVLADVTQALSFKSYGDTFDKEQLRENQERSLTLLSQLLTSAFK